MLGLWLFEVLICGAVFFHLLNGGGGMQAQAAIQAAVLGVGTGLILFAVGLYTPDIYSETRSLSVSAMLVCGVTGTATCLVAWLGDIDITRAAGPDSLRPIEILAGWALFVTGIRFLFGSALRANIFARRVIVVVADPGADAAAVQLVAALRSFQSGFYDVAAVVPVRDVGLLMPELLQSWRIWGVIVTAEAQPTLASLQLQIERHCHVWSEAEFWESRLHRIDIDHPFQTWSQEVTRRSGWFDAALSHGIDIALSVGLLAFTLPLLLLVALLIKLDSPGPVLYCQERVGLRGRHFILLKFRSMRVDAELNGPAWASRHDARVTRVGAFIRLCRIDELPQLINVLRGEMSFVGPRPERPYFVEKLAGQVPLYRERAKIKPGVTGWAQINFPYGASVEDARNKLSYDLYYVKHRSMLLNVLILFSTVRVVLFQKGAR